MHNHAGNSHSWKKGSVILQASEQRQYVLQGRCCIFRNCTVSLLGWILPWMHSEFVWSGNTRRIITSLSCCRQAISLGYFQILLPAEPVRQYRAKELEYATKHIAYCHVPNCSTFISPVSIKEDISAYLKCQIGTCSICKSRSHADNCPQDTATLDLLRIAAEDDWQRFYSGHRMVEFITRCNHISVL